MGVGGILDDLYSSARLAGLDDSERESTNAKVLDILYGPAPTALENLNSLRAEALDDIVHAEERRAQEEAELVAARSFCRPRRRRRSRTSSPPELAGLPMLDLASSSCAAASQSPRPGGPQLLLAASSSMELPASSEEEDDGAASYGAFHREIEEEGAADDCNLEMPAHCAEQSKIGSDEDGESSSGDFWLAKPAEPPNPAVVQRPTECPTQ